MKRFLAALLPAALLMSRSLAVHAVDGVSAEYGRGTRDVNMWRVAVQYKMDPFGWMERHRRWSWYWDLGLGGWHGDHGTVHDVSATPVFRYAKADRGPYIEGAIGFHVLTDSHINSDLDFSTRFQFGDHVGIGVRKGKFDWQGRLQHLSNGGMRNPNPGINFLIFRVQYHLD